MGLAAYSVRAGRDELIRGELVCGAGDVAAYRAMERAVKAGKVRSIGLSNWYEAELKAFLP